MNLKDLLLGKLALGIILSVSTTSNIALSEPTNNLKSNVSKPLQTELKITYKKAIKHTLNEGGITTKFFPQDSQGNNIALSTLASELGYDHFNWVNYVEVDPYGIKDRDGKVISAPYNDPPMGGYEYDWADNLPFYWDVVECDRCKQRNHIQNSKNLQPFHLVFQDAPTDYRLQPGESIEFITSLVGVKNIDLERKTAAWDTMHTFRWKITQINAGNFKTFLVDTDVDMTQLPSLLFSKMILDGAELSTSIKTSNSN